MAIGLCMIGFIYWSVVSWAVFLLVRELIRTREQAHRRLNIVNQMQGIPFGNLAFNVDSTCSICFEHYLKDDEVLQLKCHNSHIFHKNCIQEWVRQS